MKNLYKILEIPMFSKPEDVKSAYRKLAKVWHPDINAKKNAKAKFLEIQEAYEILTDPAKKTIYDHLMSGSKKKSKKTARQSPKTKSAKNSFDEWIDQERDLVYKSYLDNNTENERLWQFELKFVKNDPWQIYAIFLISLWLVSLLSQSTFGLYLLPILSLISFLIGCKKD